MEPTSEPRDAPGYVSRAVARQGLGDLLGAAADCSEALKLDPQYLNALIVRGMVRHAQGYLDRALAEAEAG